jgi:hypothetical protein
MNNKFDELAKGLAQSTTRRQALKKFGVGVAGMALACFGLVNVAEAKRHCSLSVCDADRLCCPGFRCCMPGGSTTGYCSIGCGL